MRNIIKQLTAEKDFNLSLFHKVFTQIYGDTPYAYMKVQNEYRR